MKLFKSIVLLLMVLGSLNWGLIGFFNVDAVAFFFKGMHTGVERVIYGVIGLAGLYGISFLCHCCKCGENCRCSRKK